LAPDSVLEERARNDFCSYLRDRLRRRLELAKRNIGQEILDGLDEISECNAGKRKLVSRELSEPSAAAEIRAKLDISQSAFAALSTVQEWEQGRRQPQGPAKALLRVAEHHPEAFVGLR